MAYIGIANTVLERVTEKMKLKKIAGRAVSGLPFFFCRKNKPAKFRKPEA